MKEFDIKKRAFNFSLDLLRFMEKLDHSTEGLIFSKQLIRSGTSIGANVAESKGGLSKKDFSHYFSIALKSANETDYWLKLLSARSPRLSLDIKILLAELEEIIKVLAKIVINSRKDS